ncbi:hypothetical protein QEG98_19850 [Myxococcus sp. MxC21-1]|uniref:hypothetical protein n=1 Tax=Myxococcus sp. MxC21-1 TaxID=3041439 RepID=UPI00292DB5C9|nr:hypothetical protein [Myxococcus sp. MxC21-1]WNZ65663.1 hypothetical protein QEG98_19850 [Myxococcus sp. MxC21-1]
MTLRALPLLMVLAMPVAGLAATPDVTVSWSPERIVLGTDAPVTLKVQVPAGTGTLHAAASTGTFDSNRVERGAVRLFQWRPPSVRYPQVAVLLFWTDAPTADAPPPVTVVRLPLVGLMDLDVATAAGAHVEVEVANRRFGPVRANARGQARVPVEVPPGVRQARVLATRGTLRTDAAVPLDPPPDSPLAAALTPPSLPSVEGGWLLMAGEAPLRASDVDVVAEGAAVALPHEDMPTSAVVAPTSEAPRTTGPLSDPATRTAPARSSSAPPAQERPTEDAPHSADVGANAQDVLRVRVVPASGARRVKVRVRHRDQAHASHTEAGVTVRSTPVTTPASEAVDTWRSSFFLLAGGVIARSANTGPSGGVGVSVLTPWWRHRIAAELEVGARTAMYGGPVETLGAVRSQVLALPLLLSVRAELLRRGAFSLHGRAGAGPVPFHHYLSSEFQGEVKESRVSGMGFVSLQAAHRFGRWSALAEARGAWAPVHTPWLDSQLGGLAMYLGMRFEP